LLRIFKKTGSNDENEKVRESETLSDQIPGVIETWCGQIPGVVRDFAWSETDFVWSESFCV
ncbi:hypothetical protein BgiBS90_005634, partial [Biomphalaria glabrata]